MISLCKLLAFVLRQPNPIKCLKTLVYYPLTLPTGQLTSTLCHVLLGIQHVSASKVTYPCTQACKNDTYDRCGLDYLVTIAFWTVVFPPTTSMSSLATLSHQGPLYIVLVVTPMRRPRAIATKLD